MTVNCIPVSSSAQHNKGYASEEEYQRRLKIFTENVMMVEKFNSEKHSYESELVCRLAGRLALWAPFQSRLGLVTTQSVHCCSNESDDTWWYWWWLTLHWHGGASSDTPLLGTCCKLVPNARGLAASLFPLPSLARAELLHCEKRVWKLESFSQIHNVIIVLHLLATTHTYTVGELKHVRSAALHAFPAALHKLAF